MLWGMADGNGTGKVDERARARSVIAQPPGEPGLQASDASSILWFVAGLADSIVPWGRMPKQRDLELRGFWPTEGHFASALGIVSARNAAFSWNVEGPPRTSTRLHDILVGANQGEGWTDLMLKTSIDLYTQDHGAFWEVVRESDSPSSPVLAINHLDAYRCFHTGHPDRPVIYQDINSRYHLLNWWNVCTLAEMPTPIEGKYGLQYCAITRLLRSVQIARNISIRNDEKTGGRYHGAIHLVKGVTTKEINDAAAIYAADADTKGLLRYAIPLVVGSVDPKADVGHDTIEMTSLPDGWDEEKAFKLYIALIAMAFLTDYQEFAPLPGGNLGTSAQSEVLHQKSRGKGPGLFMKMVTHALNFKIFPKGVEFYFDEQDIEAEQAEAELRKARAETYKLYIESGLLDVPATRQLALDAGDIPVEVFAALGGNDVTTEQVTNDEEQADAAAPPPPAETPAPPVTEDEQGEGAAAGSKSTHRTFWP